MSFLSLKLLQKIIDEGKSLNISIYASYINELVDEKRGLDTIRRLVKSMFQLESNLHVIRDTNISNKVTSDVKPYRFKTLKPEVVIDLHIDSKKELLAIFKVSASISRKNAAFVNKVRNNKCYPTHLPLFIAKYKNKNYMMLFDKVCMLIPINTRNIKGLAMYIKDIENTININHYMTNIISTHAIFLECKGVEVDCFSRGCTIIDIMNTINVSSKTRVDIVDMFYGTPIYQDDRPTFLDYLRLQAR